MSAQLVYDDKCRFCCVAAAAVLLADRSGRLTPRALHDTTLPEDSWHLVREDGTTLSAGAAAPSLLRLLPAGRAPAAALAAAPQATERGYRFIAARRSAIGRMLPEALVQSARRTIAQRLSD